MGQIIKVRGIERLSVQDLQALERAAAVIDVHPDWLASVMSLESGLQPNAVNPLSGATGLIQFMRSTARNLGTTTEALKDMSFQEQLPYVVRYFGEKEGLLSLEDTYLKVFYPAAIDKPDGWVVARAPSPVYRQNSGFDKSPKKGYINKSDICKEIRRVYSRGVVAGVVSFPSEGV